MQHNNPVFVLAPSVLRFSKPRMPVRVRPVDLLTTTSTTSTTSSTQASVSTNDHRHSIEALVEAVDARHDARLAGLRNDTLSLVRSLNRSLVNSSSEQATLGELTASLYRNEYVQAALGRLFAAAPHTLVDWRLVGARVGRLALTALDVLVIGMRYYALLGVLATSGNGSQQRSLVCLALASVYMAVDVVCNVLVIGLCEGLKLDAHLDMLKGVRRWLGAGFVDRFDRTLHQQHKSSNATNTDADAMAQQLYEDARILFSTGRIVYTLVKSLPHLFCLAYVSVRLSSACVRLARLKLARCFLTSSSSSLSKNSDESSSASYEYVERRLANGYSLIYTKKSKPRTLVANIYSKLTRRSPPKRIEEEADEGKAQTKSSFEDQYVKQLFQNNNNKKVTEAASIWHKLLGALVSPRGASSSLLFRFSTRVVCTYTVCFTVLYYLTCFVVFYGAVLVDMLHLPAAYKRSLLASALLAALVCFVQLALSLRQLKLHLTAMYKGRHNHHHRAGQQQQQQQHSIRRIATSSFNYAGYAVTYTCWGYMFIFGLFALVSSHLATLTLVDVTTTNGSGGGGASMALVAIVALALPVLVSVLLVKMLSRCVCSLVAKYCFVQRRSRVLALKNLNAYSLFIYFKFFYDCFAGMAFCVVRILAALLMAVLYLPRLDSSFMGRAGGAGLESMDHAFMSYVGFLYWEAAHTNPVAIAFCQKLLKSLNNNHQHRRDHHRRRRLPAQTDKTALVAKQRSTRARNRWFLVCLLSKNPSLCALRRRR